MGKLTPKNISNYRLGCGFKKSNWVCENNDEEFHFITKYNGGDFFYFRFKDYKIQISREIPDDEECICYFKKCVGTCLPYERYIEELNKKQFLIELDNFEGFWFSEGLCDGYPDSEFEGADILVKINDYNYIYICESIVTIKTEEKILDFFSKIGNNAVVYSFALSENYLYFFDTCIKMSNEVNGVNDVFDKRYEKGNKKEKIEHFVLISE